MSNGLTYGLSLDHGTGVRKYGWSRWNCTATVCALPKDDAGENSNYNVFELLVQTFGFITVEAIIDFIVCGFYSVKALFRLRDQVMWRHYYTSLLVVRPFANNTGPQREKSVTSKIVRLITS